MGKLFIVGTADTKSAELFYAKERAEAAGANVCLVDVSTQETATSVDVTAAEVATFHPDGQKAVLGHTDRGVAISAMTEALSAFLLSRDDIGCVLGLGGTGNTALVTAAMRRLPVGIPKIMLSTVASGNTAPYMGPNDITMMYSVVDIAGLNSISRRVIANAAHAAAGMATNTAPTPAQTKDTLGMTMFGVTTQCVNQVRAPFENDYDVAVFHATGIGGQSMEKLVDSGFLTAVADLTTTEVPDLLFGGVFAATEDRFGSIIRSKCPYLGSVGAVDMVNFGAIETVPAKYKDRNLYVHNSQVTLMRTTIDENVAIGQFIVERLNQMDGPVRFLLPLGGVSAIDAPDKPFHDPEADNALFETIRKGWQAAPNRKLIEIDANINDPAFAAAAIAEFSALIK